ncbi:MAG: hypothetical protein K5945_05235 [Bacteroidaceae bacterium]|nr:hypothetical protein [Bacteroidaceae bacterium]
MKTNAKLHLSLGVVIACMLLSACVDKNYDMDDIDWTLGSNVDLKLPYCSTDSIYLRNIMDLKDDGVVQYVWSDALQDSFFCVKQSGKANVQPVNVEQIRIKKPAIGNINATVPLRNILNPAVKRKLPINITVPGMGNVSFNVPDKEYFYEILENSAVNHIEDNAMATNINHDVVSIEKITIKENVATLQMSVVGLPSFVDYIFLNDLTMDIPRGLDIGTVTFQGATLPPSRITGNRVKITEGETKVNVKAKLVLTVSFIGITEGEDFIFDATNHTASIEGGFSIGGTFGIKTADFNAVEIQNAIAELSDADIQDCYINTNIDKLMPENISFTGSAAFSGDIEVQSFTGDVHHKVEDIEPIMLDDLPNFLNDPEVVLDLDNPVIFLKAKSQIPATATTSITVKNVEHNVSVTATGIQVQGGSYPNVFYIADKPVTDLPDEYKNAKRLTITGGKITDLIRRIPHQIDVEVADITMHAENLNVTQDYEIDVAYEVYAPIAFGKDFLLVYRDTERGWAEDIEDVEDVDFGYLQLTAKAYSDLSAETELRLIPIDKEGNAIPQLDVNTINVPANANGAGIDFTIKPKSGYTINDVLNGNEKKHVSKLDGVQYEARLKGTDSGGTLKRNAYMILRQVQITIKGGITYDAN